MTSGEVDDVLSLGLEQLHRCYRDHELTPVEVLEAVAARAEAVQRHLNAFTTLCLERAVHEAELATRRFANGTDRELEGMPIAVKDLLDTEGVRTTYGSAIFASHVPDVDASAVRRVRDAGAIVVGKTATHEFAWGITCDNPHYGPCRNPWDRERVSGGSSGGSAVALATGVVPLALGSDTGGSIRIPAAFCGVTGFKPTYGRVDPAGTFPLAPSLDHVGPMARCPDDAWRLYSVIAGVETKAGRNSRALPSTRADTTQSPLAGLRVGLCQDLHGIRPTDDVERVLAEIAGVARDLGATLIELEFDDKDLIGKTFATVQRAEAINVHHLRGLFPQRGAEYGEDVRSRLEQASELTLGDYLSATADRTYIGAKFSRVFERVDLLLTPVSAAPPINVGESRQLHRGREVDFRGLVLGATTPQNLAGLPACTLRGGFDNLDLPIGLQLTGPQGSDTRVVAAADRLFEATSATQGRQPQLG